MASRHRIWDMYCNSAIDTECTFINVFISISNSFYYLLRIYSIIARKYYLKQKKIHFCKWPWLAAWWSGVVNYKSIKKTKQAWCVLLPNAQKMFHEGVYTKIKCSMKECIHQWNIPSRCVCISVQLRSVYILNTPVLVQV